MLGGTYMTGLFGLIGEEARISSEFGTDVGVELRRSMEGAEVAKTPRACSPESELLPPATVPDPEGL